jgi:hypothetical protein
MENKDLTNFLLIEVRDDIKAIKSDVESIKILDAAQNAHLEAHMARTQANEDRIHRLEDFKWYFAGIAVIMSVVVELFRRFI